MRNLENREVEEMSRSMANESSVFNEEVKVREDERWNMELRLSDLMTSSAWGTQPRQAGCKNENENEDELSIPRLKVCRKEESGRRIRNWEINY
jgi:hypothetical protein